MHSICTFTTGVLSPGAPSVSLGSRISPASFHRVSHESLHNMDLRPNNTQSTENMLVNAANVDPFLEGRRPRHVWSHQLRVDAAAGGGGGKFASCLGPSGERALFETLSSGAEGAFVAWVKGGHETRQECKRLVVDMLDLLAAPGGQTPAFFQRGAQARRPLGGRVGIAAAKTTATAAAAGTVAAEPPGPAAAPAVDKTRGDEDRRPSPVDREEERGGEKARGGMATLSDTAVEGFQQDQQREGLEERRGSVDAAGGDGGEAATAHEEQSGLAYGYASLRKIREREPLPEVYLGLR